MRRGRETRSVIASRRSLWTAPAAAALIARKNCVPAAAFAKGNPR